jgi:hypothetical protein
MQFTNKSGEARTTPWGVVGAGEPLTVTADESVGLVLQCGPDGAWEPADDDAKAAVAAATDTSAEAPAEVKPKASRAAKVKE